MRRRSGNPAWKRWCTNPTPRCERFTGRRFRSTVKATATCVKPGRTSRFGTSRMNDRAGPSDAPGTRRISGVRELADDYDAFLVDSYGVLHDGKALYAGSADCLERLRAHGRSVVVITNTPRRASVVSREIEKVGI